jgi:hypothetical protein
MLSKKRHLLITATSADRDRARIFRPRCRPFRRWGRSWRRWWISRRRIWRRGLSWRGLSRCLVRTRWIRPRVASRRLLRWLGIGVTGSVFRRPAVVLRHLLVERCALLLRGRHLLSVGSRCRRVSNGRSAGGTRRSNQCRGAAGASIIRLPESGADESNRWRGTAKIVIAGRSVKRASIRAPRPRHPMLRPQASPAPQR